MELIIIAHIVNIIVAGSIGTLLLINHPSMARAYGDETPARSILMCMYLTTAILSGTALAFSAITIMVALVLFPFQIIYKVATVATVGIRNPIVIINLVIVILLAAALFRVVGV